jgi:hypothetical protein
MYILNDYSLIVTKDTEDRPDFSSERSDPSGTALARTSSKNNKPQLSKIKSLGERQIGRGSQKGRLTPRRRPTDCRSNVTLTLTVYVSRDCEDISSHGSGARQLPAFNDVRTSCYQLPDNDW